MSAILSVTITIVVKNNFNLVITFYRLWRISYETRGHIFPNFCSHWYFLTDKNFFNLFLLKKKKYRFYFNKITLKTLIIRNILLFNNCCLLQ